MNRLKNYKHAIASIVMELTHREDTVAHPVDIAGTAENLKGRVWRKKKIGMNKIILPKSSNPKTA